MQRWMKAWAHWLSIKRGCHALLSLPSSLALNGPTATMTCITSTRRRCLTGWSWQASTMVTVHLWWLMTDLRADLAAPISLSNPRALYQASDMDPMTMGISWWALRRAHSWYWTQVTWQSSLRDRYLTMGTVCSRSLLIPPIWWLPAHTQVRWSPYPWWSTRSSTLIWTWDRANL